MRRPIISPEAQAAGPAIEPLRRLSIALLCVFCGVLLLSSLRLLVIVAATPSSLWLSEFPALLPQPDAASERMQARAEGVSRYISDSALFTARYQRCRGTTLSRRGVEGCLTILSDALRSYPTSSELWLEQASLFDRAGDEAAFLQALGMSYEFGSREFWVARQRAPLALIRWNSLPASTQASAAYDVRMLTSIEAGIEYLAGVYAGNPELQDRLTRVLAGEPGIADRLPALMQRLATQK